LVFILAAGLLPVCTLVAFANNGESQNLILSDEPDPFVMNYYVEGIGLHATYPVDENGLAYRLPVFMMYYPEKATVFLGWYTAETGGSLFDFSVALDKDTDVYAQFEITYLIKYKSVEGGIDDQYVIDTRVLEYNEPIPGTPYADGLLAPSDMELAHIAYWYIEGDSTKAPFVLGTGATCDLTLVPYWSDSYWVYFESEGSAVKPQVVESGNPAVRPEEDPTRLGFDFAGWTRDPRKDPSSSEPFNFSTIVTDDIMLYAMWVGRDDIPYTVAIWMEKPGLGTSYTPSYTDPSKASPFTDYNYVISVPMTGTAGTMTHVGPGAGGIWPTSISSLFTTNDLLKYAEYQGTVDKVIAGNGSTVINIFTTRKLYTWEFNPGSADTATTQYRLRAGSTIYDANNHYFMTAKYEDDISSLFPIPDQKNLLFESRSRFSAFVLWPTDWTLSPSFFAWTNDGRGIIETTSWQSRRNVIDTTFLSSTGTGPTRAFNLEITFYGKEEYRYFIEWIDDIGLSGPIITIGEDEDAKDYVEMTEYRQPLVMGGVFQKKIVGLLALNDGDPKPWFTNTQGADFFVAAEYGRQPFKAFFYDRIEYPLTFMANRPDGATAEVMGMPDDRVVKFGALVGSAPATEPTLEGYIFMGWYKDADGKEAFDFSVTMPNGPLAAYARWKPSDFIVTYYDSLSSTALPVSVDGIPNPQPVGRGLPVDLDEAPYQPGDVVSGRGTFEGWYVKTEDIWSRWPAERLVIEDLDLYAGYLTYGFTVTYVAWPGTPVPTDLDEYWVGRQTRLSYGESIIHPEGKVLIGWMSDYAGINTRETGSLLTPGDYSRIYGDTTFTAVYADRDDCVQIIYHSNYYGDDPNGGETVSTWVLRGAGNVTLKDGIFKRDDASLMGWKLDADGSAIDYDLGESIAAPSETLHLYGHWLNNVYRISFVAGSNGTLVDASYPAGANTISYDLIVAGTLWEDAIVRGVPVPTPSDGYEFAAWHLGTISGATVDLPPAGNPAINSSRTYVAEFLPKTYTVTYQIVGGTWADGTVEDKTEIVNHGSGLASIPNNMIPSDENIAPGSWNEDPNQFGAIVRDGLIFTYTFSPLPPITITVNNASKLYGTADMPGYNGFTVSGITGDALAAFIEDISVVRTNTDEDVKRNSVTGAVESYEGVLTVVGYPGSDTNEVEVVPGDFTILPRSVTLTSGSGNKIFDNTPLTNNSVSMTGDGFIDGEGVDIRITGTITNPGFADNMFSWNFRPGTRAENYTITSVYGRLIITATASSVVLQAASATQVYDGTALVNNSYTALVLPEGVTSTSATVVGSQTMAGSSSNIITSYALFNGGTNVTAGYSDVTLIPGTLTVTERPVTITVNNASKVFGAADPTFTGSITSGTLIAPGDLGTIRYVRANTAEAVGTYVGVIEARFVSNTNYDVTVVPGNLTITEIVEIAPPTVPTTEIPNIPPPLANNTTWALINLILAVVGILAALVMLLAFAFWRGEVETSRDGSVESHYRKRIFWRIVNVLAGIGAIVLFLATEDMTLPMTLVDSMTIWHVIIFTFQVAFTVLTLYRMKEVKPKTSFAFAEVSV